MEAELEKQRQKVLQNKDKFQVREYAWLEKIKKFKADQEAATKETQEVNQILQSYLEQYKTIQALLEDEYRFDGKPSHPCQYASLFQRLQSKNEELVQKHEELQTRLVETRSAFENTSKELLIQVKQMETLGSETSDTRSKLLQATTEKARLEMSIKDLENQVFAAQNGKREANQRLKVVVERMAEYISSEDANPL